MRGDLRIDFRFQHITHALDQAGFHTWHMPLDHRRTDVELAAGGSRFEIDGGVVQPARTVAVDMEVETGALDGPFAADQVDRLAELQLTVRRRCAWRRNAQANAQIVDTLL